MPVGMKTTNPISTSLFALPFAALVLLASTPALAGGPAAMADFDFDFEIGPEVPVVVFGSIASAGSLVSTVGLSVQMGVRDGSASTAWEALGFSFGGASLLMGLVATGVEDVGRPTAGAFITLGLGSLVTATTSSLLPEPDLEDPTFIVEPFIVDADDDRAYGVQLTVAGF